MVDWYPGEYRPDPAYPPHYSTAPRRIRLVETPEVRDLEARHRAFWSRCLASALGEWVDVGIPFPIRNDLRPYGPNRVTFGLMDSAAQYGGYKKAMHCFEVCPPIEPGTRGADWVQVDRVAFEGCFLSNVTQELKYMLAHEFGHSLGFGHGGTGIMDETPDHAVVNDEEIAAARTFWGTGGTA